MAQTINVDVTPSLFQPTLYYHQGDIGREFAINISTKDGYEIPSGATVKIEATKPSGLGFSVSGSLSGNVVSFVSTEGMTDEFGRFPAQLEITSGNTVIYTANFLMVGEKNAHPASTTDGSQEEIVSEITLLVQRAESAAATAGAEAAAAAQAQVDEMMDYLPTEVTNLKSEFNIVKLTADDLEQGALSATGQPIASGSNRLRTKDYLPIKAGQRILSWIGLEITTYELKTKSFVSQNGWVTDYTFAEDCFAKIVWQAGSNTAQECIDRLRGGFSYSTLKHAALDVPYIQELLSDGVAPVVEDVERIEANNNTTNEVIELQMKYFNTWRQNEHSTRVSVPMEWENGFINTSGVDEPSGSAQRTISFIPTFGMTVKADCTNDDINMYFMEYDKDYALLERTTGRHLLTHHADCAFVRITTYSSSVAQAEHHTYITATWENYGYFTQMANIPYYYMTNSYLYNKADRIRQLARDADDVFIFITDVHWLRNAQHSPSLIQYITKGTSIKRLFNGGDVEDGVNYPAVNTFRNMYNGDIHYTTGNHDWMAPATGKRIYHAYDILNNDQIGNAFRHYYYVDNNQLKIRYVVLANFRREASNSVIEGYDAQQIAWFNSDALNVPSSDWDIIVFTHYLKTTIYTVPNGDAIMSAIDSYNADTSHTGKVLGIFQGHTHWDAIFHTPAGLPIITTTCDKYDMSNEPDLSQEVRTLGTINEQAFDVVVLDRTAKTFTAVRIGAPAMNNIDKYRTDEGFEWVGTLQERVVSYDIF